MRRIAEKNEKRNEFFFFCVIIKHRVGVRIMQCRNCGREIQNGEPYCPHCGTLVQISPLPNSYPNPVGMPINGNNDSNSKKNLTTFIILMAVLIVIVVLSFYVSSKQEEEENSNSNTDSNSVIDTSTQTNSNSSTNTNTNIDTNTNTSSNVPTNTNTNSNTSSNPSTNTNSQNPTNLVCTSTQQDEYGSYQMVYEYTFKNDQMSSYHYTITAKLKSNYLSYRKEMLQTLKDSENLSSLKGVTSKSTDTSDGFRYEVIISDVSKIDKTELANRGLYIRNYSSVKMNAYNSGLKCS